MLKVILTLQNIAKFHEILLEPFFPVKHLVYHKKTVIGMWSTIYCIMHIYTVHIKYICQAYINEVAYKYALICYIVGNNCYKQTSSVISL
jgi:hypothetical protein